MPKKVKPIAKVASRPANQVAFLTDRHLQPGEFAAQFGMPNIFTRPLKEVKADWHLVVNQVSDMLSAADRVATSHALKLDEVTIQLAFSAKGQLVFVAEAGVQASIAVSFKRTP